MKGMYEIPDFYEVSVRKTVSIKRTSTNQTYNMTATQVNMANDNAIMNVNQYNGIDLKALFFLIADVKQKAPNNICEDDSETLKDSLETIENELKQQEPKKKSYQNCYKWNQSN
jgi:hypothetical protein